MEIESDGTGSSAINVGIDMKSSAEMDPTQLMKAHRYPLHELKGDVHCNIQWEPNMMNSHPRGNTYPENSDPINHSIGSSNGRGDVKMDSEHLPDGSAYEQDSLDRDTQDRHIRSHQSFLVEQFNKFSTMTSSQTHLSSDPASNTVPDQHNVSEFNNSSYINRDSPTPSPVVVSCHDDLPLSKPRNFQDILAEHLVGTQEAVPQTSVTENNSESKKTFLKKGEGMHRFRQQRSSGASMVSPGGPDVSSASKSIKSTQKLKENQSIHQPELHAIIPKKPPSNANIKSKTITPTINKVAPIQTPGNTNRYNIPPYNSIEQSGQHSDSAAESSFFSNLLKIEERKKDDVVELEEFELLEEVATDDTSVISNASIMVNRLMEKAHNLRKGRNIGLENKFGKPWENRPDSSRIIEIRGAASDSVNTIAFSSSSSSSEDLYFNKDTNGNRCSAEFVPQSPIPALDEAYTVAHNDISWHDNDSFNDSRQSLDSEAPKFSSNPVNASTPPVRKVAVKRALMLNGSKPEIVNNERCISSPPAVSDLMSSLFPSLKVQNHIQPIATPADSANIIKDKVSQLELEIARFRRENAVVSKLREERETGLARLRKEIDDFQSEKDKELQRLEEFKRGEYSKLKRDKRLFEQHQENLRKLPEKRDREELEKLRESLGSLQEDLTKKERRWSANVERLEQRNERLKLENLELKDEVERLRDQISDMEVKKKFKHKPDAFEIIAQDLSEKYRKSNSENQSAASKPGKSSSQKSVAPKKLHNPGKPISLSSRKAAASIDLDEELERLERSELFAAERKRNESPGVVTPRTGSNRVPVPKPSGNNQTTSNTTPRSNNYNFPNNNSHFNPPSTSTQFNPSDLIPNPTLSNNSGSLNLISPGSNFFAPLTPRSKQTTMNSVDNDSIPLGSESFRRHIDSDHTGTPSCNPVPGPPSPYIAQSRYNSTAAVPGPSSIATNQSRSVGVNEPNVVEELVHPDGKTEQTYSDGSKLVVFPNGTKKRISTDGETIQVNFFNGDSKMIYPDKRIVYFYCETQARHTSEPDGTQVLEFPNKQIEKHLVGGGKEIHFPDGTVALVRSDRSEQTRFVDGTVSEIRPDGTKFIRFPGGQTETHCDGFKSRAYPDGTVKTVYADGRQETKYASGRTRIKDSRGVVVVDERR